MSMIMIKLNIKNYLTLSDYHNK